MIKVITATYPFLELLFLRSKIWSFFHKSHSSPLIFYAFFYIFSSQNIDYQSFLVYSITIAK